MRKSRVDKGQVTVFSALRSPQTLRSDKREHPSYRFGETPLPVKAKEAATRCGKVGSIRARSRSFRRSDRPRPSDLIRESIPRIGSARLPSLSKLKRRLPDAEKSGR